MISAVAKPLAGLKVLDFSGLLPGPYASMLLADLGAEVVRVEAPEREDLVRVMKPQINGQSAAFCYLNRGKRSITLDLKHADAAATVKQLIQHYDIVIEQFRPGVMARLGLGYATLAQDKPDLIYCSISSYGQTGDYAKRAGHDMNFLSVAGAMSYSGRKESGPCPSGIQIGDIAGGSQPAVIAILAAVIQRQNTGQGTHIDISMADQSFALQALVAPSALNDGDEESYETHLLNGGSIYDYYRTSDNRYMAVASLEPQFRQRLLETLGLANLYNLKDSELKPHIERRFSSQSMAYWTEKFSAVDACVEPVLTLTEASQHPSFKSRELIKVGAAGDRQIAPPTQFNFQPNELPSAAPIKGAHTEQVLAAVGFSDTEINDCKINGLFG